MRETVAWGAVAALAFLVLALAYEAFASGPSPAVLGGVAVVVGVAGAVGARLAAR
ncbi:MAG: hypothetical protein ABEJ80_04235 [Halarchaeum sp.]